MRLHGLGFELGVELAAQIPRVIGNLADFDVGAVRGLAGDAKPGGLETVFVFAVELVAMAVALVDFARPVGAAGEAVLREPAGPTAESHGAAEFVDTLQLAQLEDHAVRRAGVEFGGIGVFEAADVAGIFDDQSLHAETDAEVGNLLLAGIADGVQHARNAALAETAGDEDA